MSYTIPYSVLETGDTTQYGFGDLLLNYRYQAWYDEKYLRAIAPRFSLILPTGNANRGFGNDTVGYQWNLPFSTALGDFWFAHANAGLTFLPDAGPAPRTDLVNYNLGASAIYALTPEFNLMLEWVGSWRESPGERRHFESLIAPGMRQAFNFASGAQLVLGLAASVGLTRAAPDLGAFLYVSFEHRFLRERENK